MTLDSSEVKNLSPIRISTKLTSLPFVLHLLADDLSTFELTNIQNLRSLI